MQSQSVKNFDIIICGAGPAGCTAALALKDSGLNIAILDKDEFPRDKVCGDAIPARAVKVLKHISPVFADRFRDFEQKLSTKHTDVVYGKRKLELHWQIPAYTCSRLDFDNYLLELVKQHTDTQIYTGDRITSVDKTSGGYSVKTKKGNEFYAKLIIGADGAQSITAKKLAGYTLDREHHIGSVRAYFSGVEDVQPDKTEMFMDKKFQPGYFWIFPIAGGMANVGFGMMSTDIADRRINLKKAFYEFIDAVPELKSRFKNAELVGKLDGHSLPLGSRRVKMSGDHFMLCGDAASLVDPVTGEGIGNAMQSGLHAAEQAVSCFKTDDFTAGHMLRYDELVWGALGSELSLRTKAQKLFRKAPGLLDLIFLVSGWEPVRRLIQDKF